MLSKRADLHAVLDRIEEPETLLRQAIREMEEELAREGQRIKLLTHEQSQLSSREVGYSDSFKKLSEELNVCFESNKDDLARVLIKRQLETERHLKFLSGKREVVQKTLAELSAQHKEHQARLESMRQKAELLAGEQAAGEQTEHWTTADCTVRDEDVEVAFLREQQKRSQS